MFRVDKHKRHFPEFRSIVHSRPLLRGPFEVGKRACQKTNMASSERKKKIRVKMKIPLIQVRESIKLERRFTFQLHLKERLFYWHNIISIYSKRVRFQRD